MLTIRSYEPADEVGWVRCRVLSFLDSAFWDAVEREKERDEQPAIELVADADGTIVGLFDVHSETPAVADRPRRGGMIWQDPRQFDGELRLVKAFAHYTGDEPDRIKERYARVHDDVLYEKRL